MKVDAERAFELMYLLIQEKPWLRSPDLMDDQDAKFEDEALAFLSTLETATDWGNCSKPARRVVVTMLCDFMAKLNGPFADRQWEVLANQPPWLQAVQIICAEIRDNHPDFATTH